MRELRISKRSLLLGWLAGLLLAPDIALAHPHAWIDLRSRLVLDDEGRVRALELDWLFDDFYTAFIADEFVKAGRPSSEFLAGIAAQNLANLAEYNYFTDVRLDGERLPVGEVTQYETGLRDNRLWLRFEVPLAQPVDPRGGRLTFAVYDPTYYIEVLHLEGESIAFIGPGAEKCSADIIPPNPSFESVALASALDRGESAGDGLGELFAETVVVSCS
jgi:ABC-type uncharacterized transport system substrate-binding protein